MKRQNLKKEMIPYALLATAAVLTATVYFIGPYRGGIVSALLKFVSE